MYVHRIEVWEVQDGGGCQFQSRGHSFCLYREYLGYPHMVGKK